MAIDTSMLAFPKARRGKLQVEQKRAKRLTLAEQEREARRLVRLRDHGKCKVPGCKERSEHLHHVIYRSKSKRLKWAPENLVSLCAGHHGMVHAGRIAVSVEKDGEFIFRGAKQDLAFKL